MKKIGRFKIKGKKDSEKIEKVEYPENGKEWKAYIRWCKKYLVDPNYWWFENRWIPNFWNEGDL